MVPFDAVPGCTEEVPDEAVQQLSSDQKQLYQLARAVQDGAIRDQTASRRIGPINHARWLTLASRLLRLCVSTTAPSAELR